MRILSGVFEGRTTGTPIGILIENTDARSRDYEKIKDRFRPGHADYTYQQKYGFRDYRGGGRSSARETGHARRRRSDRARLSGARGWASGSTATWARSARSGSSRSIPPSPTRIPSSARTRRASRSSRRCIWKLRSDGDSIGARVTVVATGVPPGLGEPVFDRLDADIAHALTSINAVKAVEIGAGTRASAQLGSQHRDELTPGRVPAATTPAGSWAASLPGQDVIAHLTLKPTSSIQVPGNTIDVHGNPVEIETTGRHDPCVGLRATPIAEAMLAHRADGSLSAPPRAEYGRAVRDSGYHRAARLKVVAAAWARKGAPGAAACPRAGGRAVPGDSMHG